MCVWVSEREKERKKEERDSILIFIHYMKLHTEGWETKQETHTERERERDRERERERKDIESKTSLYSSIHTLCLFIHSSSIHHTNFFM